MDAHQQGTFFQNLGTLIGKIRTPFPIFKKGQGRPPYHPSNLPPPVVVCLSCKQNMKKTWDTIKEVLDKTKTFQNDILTSYKDFKQFMGFSETVLQEYTL